MALNKAGIYWNETLGLISLSKGDGNWITIADKNLGATAIYRYGDSQNAANCGNWYQWGNNYGFPYRGTLTTSKSRISVSQYGPSNYYSSSTFITAANYWDTTSNGNLWGNTTNTLEARKGPCPTGFHIPTGGNFDTDSELMQLSTVLKALLKKSTIKNKDVGDYLLMPTGTHRDGDSIMSDGRYWSSTPNGEYYAYAIDLSFSTGNVNFYNLQSGRSLGCFIRPFANTPVIPDNTWTKLYGEDLAPAFSYSGLFRYDENDTEYTNPLKPTQTTTIAPTGYPSITETLGSYLDRVASGWKEVSGYKYDKIALLNHHWDVIKEVDENYIPTLSDFEDEGSGNSLSICILFKASILNKYITKLYHLGKEYIFDERVSPTGINVSPTSISLTKLNQTAQITASVIPTNADDKKIIYTSSAPSIVSVSSTGLVKALGEGNATITVKSNEGGFSKSVSVSVVTRVNTQVALSNFTRNANVYYDTTGNYLYPGSQSISKGGYYNTQLGINWNTLKELKISYDAIVSSNSSYFAGVSVGLSTDAHKSGTNGYPTIDIGLTRIGNSDDKRRFGLIKAGTETYPSAGEKNYGRKITTMELNMSTGAVKMYYEGGTVWSTTLSSTELSTLKSSAPNYVTVGYGTGTSSTNYAIYGITISTKY